MKKYILSDIKLMKGELFHKNFFFKLFYIHNIYFSALFSLFYIL